MVRPRLWLPLKLQILRQDYEYRTTDGAIRNGSRNILADYLDGDDVYVKVEAFDGRREKLLKKDLIALAIFGPPPQYGCPVCGREFPCPMQVEQLNGDRRDTSPENLKCVYVSGAAQEHEFDCLDELMHGPSRLRSDTGPHPSGSPSPWKRRLTRRDKADPRKMAQLYDIENHPDPRYSSDLRGW
jgi:hypothetical protein